MALVGVRDTVVRGLSRIDFLAPLLARLTVGIRFAGAGWAKVNNLPRVVEFFTSLGIPYPELQAPFVAGVELVGGVLIAVGLASRLTAIPLIITMIVAILTALRDQVTGIVALVGLSEFAYIAILFWIAIAGPGAASLDALILRLAGGGEREPGGVAGYPAIR
jgi:putative oxidoreductase